jgi:hypothetical protein
MATIKEIKKEKKANATGMVQQLKKKKEIEVTSTDQKTKKTEEVIPVSKYKEWKLLYAPYPFSSNRTSVSTITKMESKSRVEEKDSGQYKGLCRNCKKQKTCLIPKPEGGIWHCEDYE